MTERGVANTALLTMAAGESTGNKVKQQGQSAARKFIAKARWQTGFRLSTTVSIASLVLGLSLAPGATAEQGGHDRSLSGFELQTRLTTAQAARSGSPRTPSGFVRPVPILFSALRLVLRF